MRDMLIVKALYAIVYVLDMNFMPVNP
jgi:hypothetical protein